MNVDESVKITQDCSNNRILIFKLSGFLLIFGFLFYALISIILNSNNLGWILLDSILLMLFLLGNYFLIREILKKQETKTSIKLVSGIFVIIGAMITNVFVSSLNLPVVMASALVGYFGHLMFKRQEVAIYCGSFVGMTSVTVFMFQEIVVLAIAAAIIFVLTQAVYIGFGGKLGSIAFISSIIAFAVYKEPHLSDNFDYNLIIIFFVAVLAVFLTYGFTQKFKMSNVESSSLISLVFSLIVLMFFPDYLQYTGVFFTASFIGMSSKDVVGNYYYLIISALVLTVVYYLFIPEFNGSGGKMGMMALVSVVITYGLKKMYSKLLYKPKTMI